MKEQINITDLAKVGIDFLQEVLYEEGEWSFEIEMNYDVSLFADTGLKVIGKYVSERKSIPIYVDDSNVIESYSYDPVFKEFSIYIPDYTDTKEMYKTMKNELYRISEDYYSNLNC